MIATADIVNNKRTLASALLTKVKRGGYDNLPRRGDGPPPLDLLSWTSVHRMYLRPDNRFSLPDHLYLVDMYQEAAREVVYMKAGQIGVSEMLVSYAMHACDQRAADVLYVMPTMHDVSEFSQSRFGPALESSDYLTSIVQGASRSIRGADKVSLKRIRNNWLYLRGGTVDNRGYARQLKSIPVDVLIGDEIDEMDERTMEIGRKRLGHSPIKEVRMASTPSYHGFGVHREWERSDQREWFVPCNHCGTWQTLEIDQVVEAWDDLKRPFVWHGQEEGRAWVACIKCGKELDRLARGEWVAKYPNRDVVGYHPTKLMAAHTPIIEVVRNFQTVDETKRKEAYNQDLGLPYTPAGGRMREADLDACRREYGHGPDDGVTAVMGVDVGKVLHAVIRVRADSGNRKQLFAGAVPTFEDVGMLMKQYRVKLCVVDALPETRAARAFQASFTDKIVWLCYYAGSEQGTKTQEPATWDYRKGIVNADRTRTLDATFARFYEETNTLPAGIRNVEDYYDHLTAQVRVVETKPDGTKVARYVQEMDDHYAHAENYATIASMKSLGWAR